MKQAARVSFSIQHLLHDVNIKETIEFASDLFKRADVNKTRALIEMNALIAALGHQRDQRMIAQPACLLDNRFFELSANASPRRVE